MDSAHLVLKEPENFIHWLTPLRFHPLPSRSQKWHIQHIYKISKAEYKYILPVSFLYAALPLTKPVSSAQANSWQSGHTETSENISSHGCSHCNFEKVGGLTFSPWGFTLLLLVLVDSSASLSGFLTILALLPKKSEMPPPYCIYWQRDFAGFLGD